MSIAVRRSGTVGLAVAMSAALAAPMAAQAKESVGAAPQQQQESVAKDGGSESGNSAAGKTSQDGKATDRKISDRKDNKASAAGKEPLQRFEIDEYRIEGSSKLAQIDIEEAVYPFLGPGRTSEDVEKARAALEKAYASRGYQTVSVTVPQQSVQGGVVVLKVSEIKVGRLRVKNSRFFDIDKIKAAAPSVAEGKVPDFNAVTKDIVALNQWPDRKVTPALRAGVTPGTVDVDLNVEDKVPLHGSIELNNRQSPNTTPLRLSATVHYDNLWQRGDSLSMSYQVAPQRRSDAEVFSGSYLARTDLDWLSILLYGVDSKSDVASVGGQNVVGPGQIIGERAVITLPARDNFFHTVSIGADYKHFAQIVSQGDRFAFSTPVTYVPVTTTYSATWQRQGGLTQLNAGITFGLRGLGSDPLEFDNKRYKATQNFFYFKGDLSDTEDLPGGLQLFAKAQGQLADQPLVSSEEFSLGGLETVRGYLETEALGDTGAAGSIELRLPNLPDLLVAASGASDAAKKPKGFNELRVFGFGDAGLARTLEPLTDQQKLFYLASYGVGTRFKFLDYFNGMAVFAMPLISQAYTTANKPRVLFKISGDF